MQIGASFSNNHLNWLNLNPLDAIKEFKKLNFEWIRLGCYWSEIEKESGKFNFKELDELINFCEKEKINVVLTVGMKAPRWPEYYIPGWALKNRLPKHAVMKPDNKLLFDSTLKFIEESIKHFKNKRSIKIWQVENEPLDSSGENSWRISPEFLEREIKLVRSIDPKRKIIVNLWGNLLTQRGIYKKAIELSDIVGFDLYPRVPIPVVSDIFKIHVGPLDSKTKIREIGEKIKSEGKGFWITELQSEPWENDGAFTRKTNTPSFLPKHLIENIKYAEVLNPSVILLWGFEWWYYQKVKGNLSYLNEAEKVIR